jgi:hypothetical protein
LTALSLQGGPDEPTCSGTTARALTRTSVELYERLGLTHAAVYAQQVGRYVWATCGFDFYDDDERLATIEVAEQFASALGRPRDLSGIRHSWELAALQVGVGEGPVTLADVATAQGMPPPSLGGVEEISLGKALLLGPASAGWAGLLEIRRESPGRVILGS